MTCIAVVNDDSEFLELMQEILVGDGYDAYYLKEGKSAFKRLKADVPDLIILDIRMENPETGWHILDLLKLDPVTRYVPVIVCSADLLQLNEKEQRLASLGVATLSKPFDIDQLLSCVHGMLSSGVAQEASSMAR